jgi:hypothetical protein
MLRSTGRITGHGVENLCPKVIADFLFSDDTGSPTVLRRPVWLQAAYRLASDKTAAVGE